MIVTPIGSIPVTALVTMVVVFALLTLAIVAVIRWYVNRLTDRAMDELRIDLRRHAEAVERHAELSAALALVKQFKANPELAAKLAGFSRETVLAVLTRHVEALGGDIEHQQQQLSRYRQRGYTTAAQNTEQLLEALRAELRIADQAVQEFAAESARS